MKDFASIHDVRNDGAIASGKGDEEKQNKHGGGRKDGDEAVLCVN